MEHLTAEQKTKLDALLAALEKFPTPELIPEAARLRIPLVDGDIDEAAKKRMRSAIGGGIAAQKILAYIAVLRSIDKQRVANNREIGRLAQRAAALRLTDPTASVEPDLLAAHKAGEQEVHFHFFAICATRIATYLPIAARSAGYKVPKADADLLASYWSLRHHYEHFEDRLPGGKNDHLQVTETHDEDEWRVRSGLEQDAQGRFVIDGQAIDVTSRGLAAIEAIAERTWFNLRANALEEVRKHFLADPSDIPSPESLQRGLLVSLGGAPEGKT